MYVYVCTVCMYVLYVCMYGTAEVVEVRRLVSAGDSDIEETKISISSPDLDLAGMDLNLHVCMYCVYV